MMATNKEIRTISNNTMRETLESLGMLRAYVDMLMETLMLSQMGHPDTLTLMEYDWSALWGQDKDVGRERYIRHLLIAIADVGSSISEVGMQVLRGKRSMDVQAWWTHMLDFAEWVMDGDELMWPEDS